MNRMDEADDWLATTMERERPVGVEGTECVDGAKDVDEESDEADGDEESGTAMNDSESDDGETTLWSSSGG